MADGDLLPRSYREARAAFLEAAEAAGARITSAVHPLRGIDDEELAIDVAEHGPADADDVVVVVSGTHGVEGYLGSALQTQHLRLLADGSTGGGDGPGLVFIHALNPYGFSWVRRVNEDNVDLNRNFIDWTAPLPVANVEYAEMADTFVPGDWSVETQERTLLEMAAKLEEVGAAQLQQIVSGGQYSHPTGVFYGGAKAVWSNDWLQGFLGGRLAGVRRAAIIDLHTGLGPWGHGELISSEKPDSEAYARQTGWWGEVTSLHDGSSVSAELVGDWLAALPSFVVGPEITGIAIEYGTVDSITVLQSLRADAVLHATGDPIAPGAVAIRDQVRAAFLDDDPTWLATCADRYRSVVKATLAALA
ncbi:MAG TPA: DUF2817 domain-containing protein [Acidimicrobiales bacterium]|nr:DUF2817 domain-containing protein [Acidimicrobiales bacterium]